MLDFERFYKKFGTRKVVNFFKPLVINTATFEFPINSMLYYLKNSDIIEPVTKVGILKNTDKVYVKTIFDYPEETVGSFSKRSMSQSSVIDELIAQEKQFKFIRPDAHNTSMTNRSLLVINYGALNATFRYGSHPLSRYYKWVNLYTKAISQLVNKNYQTDRNRFITIDIPNTLPKRIDLDKYSHNMLSTYLEDLPTNDYFNLIDLWKYLTPKYKETSILNMIPREELEKVTLMLTIETKVILLNMKVLTGFVKEYDLDAKIDKYNADTVRKTFYYFLFKLISSPSFNLSQIDNSNVVDDTIMIRGLNDNVDKLTAVTKENEPLEEIDIDHVLNTEVSDTYIEKSVEVSSAIADDEDDEDTLFLEEDVEPEITATEIKTAIRKSESVTYSTIEDVLYDTPNSKDKLIEQINVLDMYGMISKKGSSDLKEIIANQNNTLSPYKDQTDTVGELLDDTKDVIHVDPKDTKITPNPSVFDDRLNQNIVNVMDTFYLKNQYKKDIIRSVYAIQNSSSIVEEYSVTPNESILGATEEHSISIRTLNGKPSKVKIILPKIQDDGSFKISGNTYRMRKQRADLPIRKIDANIVALSSYYGKLFISKASYKKDDAGYWFRNQLVKKYESDTDLRDVVFITMDNKDLTLPLEYSIVSRYVKTFRYKNMYFNFDYNDRVNMFKGLTLELLDTIESNKVILIGVLGTSTPIVMDFKNRIFTYKDNSFKEIDSIEKLLGFEVDKKPIEYSIIKIYKKVIPTVVLLSYYVGLDTLLHLLKVNYHKQSLTAKINTGNIGFDDYYRVRFADIVYYIEKDHNIGDMIFSGLLSMKEITKEIKSETFNSKDKFNTILNKMGLSILYTNEIKLLDDMFIDPITLSLLKKLKEPITFKGLLIRANELLVDDNYVNPNDINGMVMKGYERVAGMVYKELVTAIKEHDNRSVFSKSKITINPYSLINKINEDSTTVMVDDLNPIATLKQTEDITYLGAGGRGKDGMSKDTRIMHSSEIGIMSEATKDSGDVGISAYLTANPKIADIRGSVEKFDFNKDGWGSVLSTSALLAPFGTNDDVKRLNFSSIMNSHVIPIKGMRAPYVRTGYESIIPIRAGEKFVIVAKESGTVTKVTAHEVEIQYQTLGKIKHPIKHWTTKEESGACYTHYMVSNVKVGDTVIKDDTIIYDSAFFESDIFNPKRVVYRQGDVITVALSEDPQTYEDSGAISKEMSKHLATTVTKVKSIVVSKDSNIIDMKKVGDKVEPSTVLFTILDDIIGDITQVDERTKEILQNLKSSSPKAKIRGTINKVVILYNCELDTVNETLKELIIKSDEQLVKDTKFTGKVDSSYSIKGIPLAVDNVEIKIYIDVYDNMGIGDKAIFGNQLKFTVGEVYEYGITALDGTVVDAVFSNKSIMARIVNSPNLIGTTSMVLEQVAKRAIEMYFEE